jgi:hypothetical protein
MAEQLTMDERASEYVKKTFLDKNTYEGDVFTAYVVGCIDQQRIDTAQATDQLKKSLLEAISLIFDRVKEQLK